MKTTFTIKCGVCGAIHQVSRSMRGPVVDVFGQCSCKCGHNFDSREFVPGTAKMEGAPLSDALFCQAMDEWDEAAEAEEEEE